MVVSPGEDFCVSLGRCGAHIHIEREPPGSLDRGGAGVSSEKPIVCANDAITSFAKLEEVPTVEPAAQARLDESRCVCTTSSTSMVVTPSTTSTQLTVSASTASTSCGDVPTTRRRAPTPPICNSESHHPPCARVLLLACCCLSGVDLASADSTDQSGINMRRPHAAHDDSMSPGSVEILQLTDVTPEHLPAWHLRREALQL